MPPEFDRCIAKVTKQRMKDGLNKDKAKSSAFAICTAQFKKAGKPTQSSRLLTFSYNIPINEFGNVQGDFIINGIAINSTITSNNHKFLPEVLRDSAESLINVPLLTDHENMVENIKGRVISAFFDEDEENIKFKAIIKDQKIKQLIQDKLLNTVSVGAAVDPEDIDEIDGLIIPKNIQFKELSLVAVPADDGATFSVAMKEAYEDYKSHSTKVEEIDERRLKTMTEQEETTSKETETSEETSEEEEEKKEVSDEEKEIDEKIEILRIKAKKKKLKELQEADADETSEETEEPKETKETPKETKETEEEEEEEEEEVEEKSKYNIVQEGRSFTYKW